jgi:hypothetical protein
MRSNASGHMQRRPSTCHDIGGRRVPTFWSILSPVMAGIEALMTLGGIADGGTHSLSSRTARGTIAYHQGEDIFVLTPTGLRGTLPIVVCVSCPGVLNHNQGAADASRSARNRPDSIRERRRHTIRLPDARLILYPDSGHSSDFQFFEQFAEEATRFFAAA